MRRSGGLRLGEFAGKRLRADDQLVHSQPHKHRFRFQQHAELGDDRGDEYCDHAGNIHVHIGKRFDEREPDGDDHLHADGHQRRRLGHGHGNSYGKRGKQANDQLVHG